MIELLLTMAFEFFKTGLFAVGGGLATIPFLKEIGVTYGWYTMETLSTMIAVSESTPGPMGITMATYVGYTIAGIPGSLVATLSLVTPSIIIICVIANYFEKFKQSKIVQMAFKGLRPAVIAFIINACYSLFASTLLDIDATSFLAFFNWKCIALFVILGLLYYKYPKIHPIWIIVITGACGILFQL